MGNFSDTVQKRLQQNGYRICSKIMFYSQLIGRTEIYAQGRTRQEAERLVDKILNNKLLYKARASRHSNPTASTFWDLIFQYVNRLFGRLVLFDVKIFVCIDDKPLGQLVVMRHEWYKSIAEKEGIACVKEGITFDHLSEKLSVREIIKLMPEAEKIAVV
jgi:hypothetical protein